MKDYDYKHVTGYYSYETVSDGLVCRSTKRAITKEATRRAKSTGQTILVYSPAGYLVAECGRNL